MTSAIPPFPIIVGVTGHRDILPETEADLRASVGAVLAGLQKRFGAALHLMVSLTDGADLLAADVAESITGDDGAPLKLIAVSPMSIAAFRKTVTDTGRLDHHWKRAVLRLELPVLDGPKGTGDHELQYEQLGVLLSRRSHLLLALWDGLPPGLAPPPRRGGTAAVVRMRREGEDALPGFRHSPLFPEGVSRLDLSQGGPVVQIVAPRAKTGGQVAVTGWPDAKPGAKAGDCFVLPDEAASARTAPESAPKSTPVAPGVLFAGLDNVAHDPVNQVDGLNDNIRGFGAADRRLFERQLGYLIPRDVADPAGDPGVHLARLRQWQAASDTAAQFFQRRLMGELTPAKFPLEMWKKVREAVRDYGRPPLLGIVFMFAALVPIAVLLFETYAHMGRSPLALGLYLVLFAGAAAFYRFRVHRHELQNRFQDYRALAEAMRVQLFWAAAAMPEAASDSALRKQSGELGWIQFALRGPAAWATAAALGLDQKPCRALVMKGWVRDQIEYFFGVPGRRAGKAADNANAAKRGELWAQLFLGGGLVFSLMLALIEAARVLATGTPLAHDGRMHRLIEAQDLLLVLAATSPALAAFFTVWVELRAYQAQAHSYDLMGRIFTRAEAIAQGAGDDQVFIAVMRDLGREALAENAEWLLDHRRRKIEQK